MRTGREIGSVVLQDNHDVGGFSGGLMSLKALQLSDGCWI